MIGRFIFECETENLIVAGKAIKLLQARPESKHVMLSQGEGDSEIIMFAKRLKKSIRVQQVKP